MNYYSAMIATKYTKTPFRFNGTLLKLLQRSGFISIEMEWTGSKKKEDDEKEKKNNVPTKWRVNERQMQT